MSPDTLQHDHSKSLDTAARWAGFLGLLPFVLALLLATAGADSGLAPLGVQIAITWGAVILSFIAAVHWGYALAGRLPWSMGTVVSATLPSVVGAAAVLLGGEKGIALLVAGFGLFWLFEHQALASELPSDYLELRRMLTIGVCTLLVLTAFAGSGAHS
ncbi:MAG: DUF3429 domain-containing protein [Gammaproteobacteria bacterium]